MKNFKYSVVFALLAIAVAPSSALWHKWQAKDKDVVVVPIQLQQVQPVQHVHHVEQVQVQPINKEPGRIVKLWSHVKDNAIVPLKNIFTKKVSPAPAPVPDYRVWPSLGFSHYKKVQYYPTEEHNIVDPQIPLEFPTVYVERIPASFDGHKPQVLLVPNKPDSIPVQPHHQYNVPYPPAPTVPHQEHNVPYPPAPTVPHQEYNVPYPPAPTVPHQAYNVPYPPAPTVPHQEYNVPHPYPQPQEGHAPGSPGGEFAPGYP